MNKEFSGESDEFKDLVTEELKNIELAKQMEKKKEIKRMRQVAKEEAAKLWHQKKEMEKAKVEAEHKRLEELKMEQERKNQKEIELANQQKQHEEKLKNELRSQIQLKCHKEKEMLEMKCIEEKFGTELEIQVRQEIGLPAKKIPVPDLPEPIPGMFGNTGSSYVTPSSLIEIKTEKFDHDAYTDPSTPTKCSEKRKDMEHLTPPPSKWFATKQTFQQTFTPSRQIGRSSHLQLFSPPGKFSAQSPRIRREYSRN